MSTQQVSNNERVAKVCGFFVARKGKVSCNIKIYRNLVATKAGKSRFTVGKTSHKQDDIGKIVEGKLDDMDWIIVCKDLDGDIDFAKDEMTEHLLKRVETAIEERNLELAALREIHCHTLEVTHK